MLSSLKAVERVDDGDQFGVGTRWRETPIVMGREATEEMQVTGIDPGRIGAATVGRLLRGPMRKGLVRDPEEITLAAEGAD